MVMNKNLLKEYINLVIESILLEADPIGSMSTIGSTSTSTSLSSTSTSSTATTKSSESTGSGTNKETDNSIKNLEAEILKNDQKMKAINQASGQMFNAQKSANTATVQTQQGLDKASKASQNITKDIENPEEKEKNLKQSQGDMSVGLKQAADGVGNISKANTRTQNALQNLTAATK